MSMNFLVQGSIALWMLLHKLLETLNAKEGYKIACDVPSGIMRDMTLNSLVFHADETICMGALKLSLLNDRGKDSVGKIRVANLGVRRSIYEVESPYRFLQKTFVYRFAPVNMPIKALLGMLQL